MVEGGEIPPENPEHLLWGTLTKAEEKYQHMETVGRLSAISPCSKVCVPVRWRESNLEAVPQSIIDRLDSLAGPYYRVVGTNDSVYRSIGLCDRPAPNCRTDEMKEIVRLITHRMSSIWRGLRLPSSEEVYDSLNLDTSPGQPWLRVGARKKKDFFLKHTWSLRSPWLWSKPLWKVVPKTEWYKECKILAGKVRTIIIPPAHFLWWQKMCYLLQNESLKGFFWSAYGFNPYKGGTDRMARKINRHRIKISYDVRGWDRVLPILDEVYAMRNSFLEIPPEILSWVTEHTLRGHLLMPDGLVIKRHQGNNSGSGNTTPDNILGHFIILAHALRNVGVMIDEAVANLFGDDNILSFDSALSFEEIESSFRATFSFYGMELDPFVISEDLADHAFLGFTFTRYKSYWVPRYDEGRILASLLYTINKKSMDRDMVSKTWTLTVMLAGGDRGVFDDASALCSAVLATFHNATDPVIMSFVEVGVPDFETCMSFLLGRECRSTKLSELFGRVGHDTQLWMEQNE